MARQTSTQKRLITLRQGVIILAIFILSIFAYKYAQNIMRIRAAQNELAALQAAVDEVEARQAAADEDFVNSISPGRVGEFAKEEMGWVSEGETIYVPLSPQSSVEKHQGGVETGSENTQADTEAPPNWRQWLALVAKQ